MRQDMHTNKTSEKEVEIIGITWGESESFVWLINYNLKTVNLINPKLCIVRPWPLPHKQQKVHK